MTRAVDETKHVDELRLLEAEAVHIIREVVAELERPVLLFSAGKDSRSKNRTPDWTPRRSTNSTSQLS